MIARRQRPHGFTVTVTVPAVVVIAPVADAVTDVIPAANGRNETPLPSNEPGTIDTVTLPLGSPDITRSPTAGWLLVTVTASVGPPALTL